MSSLLHVRLLGSLELLYAPGSGTPDQAGPDQPVQHVGSPRLQSLLAYLLLHPGVQSRQHLAFLLWPESEESQARTNLRNLLYQLRQVLPDADRFLSYDSQTLQWNPDAPFVCDAIELQKRLAREMEGEPSEEALREILRLYRGELLPSCYDDWIEPIRRELDAAVRQALGQLLALEEDSRAYDRAILTAQRLLAMDPLDEEANRHLMRLRALSHDRAGALRHYQEYGERLQRELGVAPDEQTQQLYAQILNRRIKAAAPKQQQADHALPMVGRKVEWQRLRELWQAGAAGRPKLVLITGVAGIGKTRLAEEMLHWAGHRGAVVARARSYAVQGAMAYAPVADLLRTPELNASLMQWSDHRLAPLARILPELIEERPNLPRPEPMIESWQRQQFREALAQAALAHSRPTLLLLDDLQWSDTETLAWIDLLLHNILNRRLLVIGTCRSHELDPDHAVRHLQRSLQRDDLVTELTLEPLNPEETALLAQQVADSALYLEGMDQLYADTEGNPLFVVETMRAAQSQSTESAANAAGTGLPPKVYAVILSRLAQLSPEAQSVANLGAVIGRSFGFEVLQDAGGASEDDLLDSLDELARRYIIREQSAGLYDFTHDRIRDVAYAEISRTRRRVLHRRVAHALESVHGDELESVSGALADHFEQAGDIAKAVHYLQRAGEWAAGQFAHDSAIIYFNRALGLISTDDTLSRMRLLLARERTLGFKGLVDAQEKDLLSLLDIANGMKDGPAAVKSLSAWVHIRWSNWHASRAEYAQAVESAREAIRLARDGGDLGTEAAAYRQYGYAYFVLGNLHQAHLAIQEALAKARAAGEKRMEARSLNWLGGFSWFTGASLTEAMDALHKAMAIYEELNDLHGQMDIHHKIGYGLINQGETSRDEAETHIAAGLKLSRQMGNPRGESHTLRNLGLRCIYLGRYDQALEALSRALDLSRGIDAPHETAVLAYLGIACLHMGDVDGAGEYLNASLNTYDTVVETLPLRTVALNGLSMVNVHLKDWEAALECGRQALQTAEQRRDSRHAAAARTCMGHAFLGMGDLTDAASNYGEARTLYLQVGQFNRSMEPLAGLAQVALTAGDTGQAADIVEQILYHLADHTLEQTEDAFRVLLTCYRVLAALGDARDRDVHRLALAQIKSRADSLADEERRNRFLSMPEHREILHDSAG